MPVGSFGNSDKRAATEATLIQVRDAISGGGGNEDVVAKLDDVITELQATHNVTIDSTSITALADAYDAANDIIEASLQDVANTLSDILGELMQKIEAGEEVGLTEDAITALATAIATLFNYPSDYPDAAANTKLSSILAAITLQSTYVDGLEANTSSTNTKLDTLHTDLVTAEGYVDGIEGALGTDTGTPPSSGTGIRGWLRGIYDRLAPGGLVTEMSGLSAGSLNADLVPSTVLGNNRSFALQVSGTFVGTITFQVSNDNITFSSMTTDDMSMTGGISQVNATSTKLVTGDFGNAKYFRARMTSYTSGTATGILELSTTTRAPRQIIANAIQSGSWTVQPGNTPNTTPWLTQSSFSYSHIATSTTTPIKSGAGILHSISLNSLGTVASSATVYDSTTGSGTVIAVCDTLTQLRTILLDVAFSTGLTIVTTGTVAPDITVAYR